MLAIVVLSLAFGGSLRSLAAQMNGPVLPPPICVGPPLPYRLPPHPIVAFGDSITWGYGASHNCIPNQLPATLPKAAYLPHRRDTTYPADLSRLLRRPVLDYGFSGEQTPIGLMRLRVVLSEVHPSTVLLLEGINDLIHGRRPTAVEHTLSAMVRACVAADARPYLLTVLPAGGVHVTDLDREQKQLARTLHVPLIDTATAFARQDRANRLTRHANGYDDWLHPNDTGYLVLARVVAAGLRHHT